MNEDDLDIAAYCNEAIIFFLQTRLPKVKNFTERAFLIGWLVELYLNRLADLSDLHGDGSTLVEEHRSTFFKFVSEPFILKVRLSGKVLFQAGFLTTYQR